MHQYVALTMLTKSIMSAYPQITKERIVGHCHVAPERKEARSWTTILIGENIWILYKQHKSG